MSDDAVEPAVAEVPAPAAAEAPTPTTTVMAGARTSALLARVEELQIAADRAGDCASVAVRGEVAALLAGVRERLALGVDHTVVALVGGTGSGKSSLLNALSGLTFADVGVHRPTTSRVTACVWAHDATALLDWLEVDRERRIERESALDGETQADLRGLVLLDLPDYDSIEAEHHAVVDRLLPQVDLLTWVVDPQKYADDALHSGYLSRLAGHEGAMLVVLNQIDTVPEHARDELVADVARLVAADGLVGVRVLAVSARTGQGLAELREALAGAVAGRGVAEIRAAAELDDAARALAGAVGPGEPGLPVERAVDALLEAAGVLGEVAAVAAGAPASAEPSLAAPTLGPVQADRAVLVREAWLAEVRAGLPGPWADAVDARLPDEGALVGRLDEALGRVQVPGPPRRKTSAWLVPSLAVLLAIGAGVAAVLLAPWWWGVAGGLVVIAVVARGLAGRARRRARVQASAALLAAGRSAVQAVVDESLAEPTRAVLADHRLVRDAARLSGGGSAAA